MNYNLSVIVPVYNCEKHIRKCLMSLFEQTLEGIEYIIINDGSTDNSPKVIYDIIAEYNEKGKAIIFINHEDNRGVSCIRQEGLDIAHGRYVIQCDADDWVDTNYYGQLYKVAETESADITIGDIKYEYQDKIHVAHFPHPKTRDEFLEMGFYHLSLCNTLIRDDYIKKLNLRLFEGLNFSEDYGFLFRCYFLADKISKYNGDEYYHYNKMNPSQVTNNIYSVDKLKQREEILILLSNFLKDNGYNPSKAKSLESEKRDVKEGFSLCGDFKSWRRSFPEITKSVLADKKLSIPYRFFWSLGQYIHSSFFGVYVLSHSNKRRSI